jgi:S-adenosyl methyltransferase
MPTPSQDAGSHESLCTEPLRTAGIRQFLDIGTGLPTMQNTYEVAQSIASECRVVYVDNDPLVLAHARALLTNTTDEGVTAYIDADFHHPELIISDARNVLNFNEPVASCSWARWAMSRTSIRPARSSGM